MSTFHGLEMAKQALFAQQSALYTTGHNISNANTKGYSRQRVNFETASPYPSASRNRPEMPGQLGTGVKTGSIERVRDKYIDAQYRSENAKSGYWNTRSASLERMENIMNEMSNKGLSHSMTEFEKSLQDLVTNPNNDGAKSVVVQRGAALADTFNHISKSLESIRSDLNKEIKNTVKTANSLLKQIDAINKQVKEIEPHGYLPNDLYDERDRLIDELSQIIDIDVEYTESADSSLDIADGIATIKLAGIDGASLITEDDFNKLNIAYGNKRAIDFDNDDKINSDAGAKGGNITGITVENYDKDSLSLSNKNGSLNGLIHSYGYRNNEGVQGDFPEMLSELDMMAKDFAEKFNKVYGESNDEPFFVEKGGDSNNVTASNIAINDELVKNSSKVNANSSADSSDGTVAQDLADLFSDENVIGNSSIHGFYESLIGDMGVEIQESNRMADNTGILLNQVNNQRQSMSSVSLDEEMSNMIKFQHAYNAAARSMTAVDEMLDKVINSMGLVGR